MKDSWVDKQMLTITNDWYLKGEVGTGVTISAPKNTWSVNATPDFVKGFREMEAYLEKEAKEKELREKQAKNKRLRGMVKKVITNEPYTVIMWSDGTKTVTKCHKLDSYDPEKGILACMAKKLYENTNLFNEIIQEYVDFDAELENECLKNSAEQAKKAIDKFQTTLTGAIDGTICDLEKELAYYKQLSEKLADDVETRDDCLSIKIKRIKGLEEELSQFEHLLIEKESLLRRLENADNRIEVLEEELYWSRGVIDNLQRELHEAQTNCGE